MPATVNRDLEKFLTVDLYARLRQAGEAGAEILRRNLSAGPRGGVHYPGMPRRSSAPNEFPQEQFGNLRGAVNWAATADPLTIVVGVINHPKMADNALAALEYGNSRGNLQGRNYMSQTFEAPETMRAMLEALQ